MLTAHQPQHKWHKRWWWIDRKYSITCCYIICVQHWRCNYYIIICYTQFKIRFTGSQNREIRARQSATHERNNILRTYHNIILFELRKSSLCTKRMRLSWVWGRAFFIVRNRRLSIHFPIQRGQSIHRRPYTYRIFMTL